MSGGNRGSENRSAYDPTADAVKTVVAGTDSNGNALPANFDSYTTVVDDSVVGVTTITSTGSAGVYVQTITTVGSVVTILPPVKQ